MREITVGVNDAGQRTDRFLTKLLRAPQSLIYKYLRVKRIKLNGKRAAPQTLLREGDLLSLYVNDELFVPQKTVSAPAGALDIVYEDDNILLLNKPPGLLCHGDAGQDTLVGRVVQRLISTGEYDPAGENTFVPALCNRLDRNTGGLVIAAKTAPALRLFNALIRDRSVEKYYKCLVIGAPVPASGRLEGRLEKDGAHNISRIGDEGREVCLDYRTLKSCGGLSLLEILLHTGRPHQIRSQLADAGYPVAGDVKYGGAYGHFKHQALYACRIRFGADAPGLGGREFCVRAPFEDYLNDIGGKSEKK